MRHEVGSYDMCVLIDGIVITYIDHNAVFVAHFVIVTTYAKYK